MLTSVVLLIHTLLKSVIGLLPLKADEKMESSQVLKVNIMLNITFLNIVVEIRLCLQVG